MTTATLAELPDVLTADEAAQVLRCSRRQVSELCLRGDLPHRRVGRLLRIPKNELLAWLSEGRPS